MTGKAQWPEIAPDDRRLFVTDAERANATPARIAVHLVDMKPRPDAASGLDAQLIMGDAVDVIGSAGAADAAGEWVKIVARRHGYVGWIARTAIAEDMPEPTHRIIQPRTFVYSMADMKSPRIGYRSMGSQITVIGEAETRGTSYVVLEDGSALVAGHVAPVDQHAPDYVAVAEKLVFTPYLWGGDSAFGLDCAGLVSLSMRMTGIDVMRDSDMQAATIGKPVKVAQDWSDLKRGDLIFWRGHVAIAQGPINGEQHIIHANGYTMDVTSEPVTQAVERIAALYERPIGVRRP